MRALALVLGFFFCAEAVAAPLDSVPDSGRLSFGIWRESTRIGTHSYRFRRDGDTVIVDHRIELAAGFAFITLYRYLGTRREEWRDGRLVAYDADTDDDGTPLSVRGRATESGLTIEGKAGRIEMPANAMGLSLWNRAAMAGGPLFGMDDGVPLKVAVRPLDAEGVARYEVSGDVNYILSYAGPILRGVRIKARDGSTVDYVPE